MKLGFVLVMVIIGTAAATGLIIPLTDGSDQAPPAVSTVTVSDMGPELKGRYRSHTVFAREMNGQLAVTFMPALPRDDRTVLGGAEYVLRRFLKVNVVDAHWRTVFPYLRVTTGSGAYDVRLIKNDDGTVHSMVIAKELGN